MRLLHTAATRGSALRGSERGVGAPASNEPGRGAEPHVIKALENRREV